MGYSKKLYNILGGLQEVIIAENKLFSIPKNNEINKKKRYNLYKTYKKGRICSKNVTWSTFSVSPGFSCRKHLRGIQPLYSNEITISGMVFLPEIGYNMYMSD